MNVRIFWVRAMKCMYAQTRPRFILSSEGVLDRMEFEPMLTPREKSPLPKMSPEEDRTRDTVDSEPKHHQLSYSGPQTTLNQNTHKMMDVWCVLQTHRHTHTHTHTCTHTHACMHTHTHTHTHTRTHIYTHSISTDPPIPPLPSPSTHTYFPKRVKCSTQNSSNYSTPGTRHLSLWVVHSAAIPLS